MMFLYIFYQLSQYEVFHLRGNINSVKLQLGTHGSNLTEEELETHTIAAWKEGKAHISRQFDGSGRPYPRPLVQVRFSQLLSTAITTDHVV